MADINVEEVLKKLTVSQKVDLLSGIDFWHTASIPEHGIPSLRTTDGPNGVRGTKFFNGTKAACFPCGTALGSTFNLPLLKEAGKKMGEEAKLKGAHVILGPTINMQRSPLGGRGFESLGEDPFLAGLGAAAVVSGIQSTGVQATIKHFVCNDQEHKRNAVQSIVTERAFREIYALPFQLAVRDAHPSAFMTGYNGVNGKYCSENPELLGKMLRGEWGWDGAVMSDWYGTYSTTEAALAGLDLEMPGPPRFRGEALKFNVATDKVREHVIDERARAMLKLIKKCAASGVKENAPELTGDTPETAALLRRIGGESLVLLKNEGNVLPLKKDKKTVVIGPNAKIATYHGGGSASLAAYYAVTPFDGISEKLSSTPGYAVGAYSHKMLPLLGTSLKSSSGKPGMKMRAYNEPPSVASREVADEIDIEKTDMLLVDYYNPKIKTDTWYADFEGSFVAEEDGAWEMSLVVSGTAKLFVNGELIVDNETNQVLGDAFFGQGTREEKGTLQVKKGETYSVKVTFGSAATSKIPGIIFGGGALRIGGCKVIDAQKEIEHAAALAKDADQVIICAGLNADWETEGHDREAMDLPPGLDALISAVAAANPNTVVVMQSGTPVTMPWASEVPALVQAWYGGNETGNAIADVLFGDVNPSGKLSLSFPKRLQDNPAFLNFRAEGGRTLYGEDVYIGYRYYEFAERDVLFPFGHGLSYTSFSLGGLSVAEKDGKVAVSVVVENTGAVKGSEVVQVYVAPKQAAKIARPRKELKGFAKVELAPGEKKTVEVEVETKYAASYWDEERSKWCAEAGEYEIIVSDSSEVKEGKALKGSFSVAETFWWTGL
ncbi:Beta-glucosidase [Pleurostoma richardsiae]|uniref:Probable beta-glucosidase I n=1 Tax=Pleurostoma richardsiae TaxID=41990 RepID=A0AA38VMA5_9PEZI|nr:Beta-glucosidase [Pleurostoma richardsiae]